MPGNKLTDVSRLVQSLMAAYADATKQCRYEEAMGTLQRINAAMPVEPVDPDTGRPKYKVVISDTLNAEARARKWLARCPRCGMVPWNDSDTGKRYLTDFERRASRYYDRYQEYIPVWSCPGRDATEDQPGAKCGETYDLEDLATGEPLIKHDVEEVTDETLYGVVPNKPRPEPARYMDWQEIYNYQVKVWNEIFAKEVIARAAAYRHDYAPQDGDSDDSWGYDDE